MGISNSWLETSYRREVKEDWRHKRMSQQNGRKIGTAALALAVLATVFLTVAQPAVAASNCSAEFTLQFGVKDSGDLSRPSDVQDIWVVDVADRSGDVLIDVDKVSGDNMVVELYEKDAGTCTQLRETEDVQSGVEFDNLDDNQKYWILVELKDSTDVQGEYDIIAQDT